MSRILVYKVRDFEDASAQIQRAIILVSRAMVLLNIAVHAPVPDHMLHWLSDEPEIQQALKRRNKRRRNSLWAPQR